MGLNEYGEIVFAGLDEYGQAAFSGGLDEDGLRWFGGEGTAFQAAWAGASSIVGGNN